MQSKNTKLRHLQGQLCKENTQHTKCILILIATKNNEKVYYPHENTLENKPKDRLLKYPSQLSDDISVMHDGHLVRHG